MKAKKGVTLIELIIVILVMGVSITAFTLLVMNVVAKNVYSQAVATAVSLAEGEMERVTGLRFSAVDDVASTQFASPFSAYSYQVIVDYVNTGNLNNPVAGPTDYKRAQVKITSGASEDIVVTSLVTNDATNQ